MAERLSEPMLACLGDAFAGPLYRQRHGWANAGIGCGHATNVVDALEKRGLLRVDWQEKHGFCEGWRGTATITGAGLERWDEERRELPSPLAGEGGARSAPGEGAAQVGPSMGPPAPDAAATGDGVRASGAGPGIEPDPAHPSSGGLRPPPSPTRGEGGSGRP